MSINRISQNQNIYNLLQQRRSTGAVNSEQKNIDFRQKNAGELAINSGIVQTPYSNYETSTKGVDVVKFGELIRTNALKKSGVAPEISNPITEVSGTKNPEAMKIDIAQVKNIFGTQPESPNAKKFNSKMAAGIYADTASKLSDDDFNKYAALAKVSLK